jgi:hypothetical protein
MFYKISQMNPVTITQLESYIQLSLGSQDLSDFNIFDAFITRCQLYYDRPAHSISEIKDAQSTKVKGDVFEHFAYMYFSRVKKWQVWFLKDLPKEIRDKLKLAKVDLGIDLIAQDQDKLYAIQAKYRKQNTRTKTVLGWKQLSTFYGIVSKTGPWKKHIVFTNADYIRHVGTKTILDKSICLGTLRGIKRHEWEEMMGFVGYKMSEEKVKLTAEQIREKRLLILDKIEI